MSWGILDAARTVTNRTFQVNPVLVRHPHEVHAALGRRLLQAVFVLPRYLHPVADGGLAMDIVRVIRSDASVVTIDVDTGVRESRTSII